MFSGFIKPWKVLWGLLAVGSPTITGTREYILAVVRVFLATGGGGNGPESEWPIDTYS